MVHRTAILFLSQKDFPEASNISKVSFYFSNKNTKIKIGFKSEKYFFLVSPVVRCIKVKVDAIFVEKQRGSKRKKINNKQTCVKNIYFVGKYKKLIIN